MENMSISADRAKAGAYVGENRKLDAMFFRKRFPGVRGDGRARANCTIKEHYGSIGRNFVQKVEF